MIPPGRRLGGVVLEVEGLSKAHGDKQLFRNLSFKLQPGQMLGIVGANGTGKVRDFVCFALLEKKNRICFILFSKFVLIILSFELFSLIF